MAVVVALYLIAQITRAQDAPVSQDSTPLPSNELRLESDVTDTLATQVPAKPTTFPTDASVVALTANDQPTLEDATETNLPSISITPEATVFGTDVPSPTLNPTDEAALVSIPANIAITARMTHVAESNMLTLTVYGEGLANVYNVAVARQVDPSVMLGIQATSGDMLPTNLSTTTDSGY